MATASLSALDWQSPWLAPLAARGAPVAQAWGQGQPVAQALNDALAGQAAQTGPDALPAPSGLPHCVPQASLPDGEAYEAFIRRTGQLPTRDNRHDFFNGLLWLHQPAWKLRLNRLQADAIASQSAPKTTRGPLRDALTLFDENGAVLLGPAPLLAALRERRWQDLFLTHRALWREARFTLVGHALLDSLCTSPRKGLTAHVLLADPLALSAQDWAQKPFCPLPVMGLPGWWPGGAQDAAFYADAGVFRPLAKSRLPTDNARPCRS
ncbi:DUF3025 domain-containing protein [Ideonella paludis]|uniref:DUF3025 domain-containing protein n=1 Tax=Ideonella paludis TaxID=1233411 RepID=UPI002872BF83|nr:DUF3025 domain-containing protein [Ideonella paludis]